MHELADGVAFLESFANVTALESNGRLALIDAGGILHAGGVHEQVRRWSDAPLEVAVYTHGHVDHVFGRCRCSSSEERDSCARGSSRTRTCRPASTATA